MACLIVCLSERLHVKKFTMQLHIKLNINCVLDSDSKTRSTGKAIQALRVPGS